MKNLILVCVFATSLIRLASAADSLEASTYQIRNVKYLELLRPHDANSANGTPIVLYPAQPWKCMTWRLQPAGDSFLLKNLFTSKTFSTEADTNAFPRFVVQVPLARDTGRSPAWQFTKLGDGRYEITETATGQALTAEKTEGENEAKIIVAPWQNQDQQKWILERMDPQNLTM